MLFLASLPGTGEAKSSHMEYFGLDRAGPPQLLICRMRGLYEFYEYAGSRGH
jgi:hypothetical protein